MNITDTEKKKDIKAAESINPTTDRGNYLVQIKVDDKVIKETVALSATVNILNLANAPAAFDIR
jgi:hypothetical protein